MRNTLTAFAIVFTVPAFAAQPGIDRPGFDYKHFDVGAWDQCNAACTDEGVKCKAWVYVVPGVMGPSGFCSLKWTKPAAVKNPKATSGDGPSTF